MNNPVSTFDLLPTFVSAGGGQVNASANVDGVNLLPYINGLEKGRPHQQLFWKKESRAAMRDGDWKLIKFSDRPAELYDLSKDISEHNNLASAHPERVREMFKAIYEWELTLERPMWLLQRKYEKVDVDRMNLYR